LTRPLINVKKRSDEKKRGWKKSRFVCAAV
jgi:hypothetical protein